MRTTSLLISLVLSTTVAACSSNATPAADAGTGGPDGAADTASGPDANSAADANNAAAATFDDLPYLPAPTDFRVLREALGGTVTYKDVDWDARFVVVGAGYVERFNNEGGGMHPFATPHSGGFAVFNSSAADALLLTTKRVLLGVWLARPSMGLGPKGTNQVTVNALAGQTVLKSLSITLVDTTPVHLDTSAFAALSGITGYRIDRAAIGGDGYGGGHWVADDFEFAAP